MIVKCNASFVWRLNIFSCSVPGDSSQTLLPRLTKPKTTILTLADTAAKWEMGAGNQWLTSGQTGALENN